MLIIVIIINIIIIIVIIIILILIIITIIIYVYMYIWGLDRSGAPGASKNRAGVPREIKFSRIFKSGARF